MIFKMLMSLLIIIGRIYLGVRVLYWIVLNFMTEVPHSISEIQVYLVFMLFDVWVSHQNSEIVITKNND